MRKEGIYLPAALIASIDVKLSLLPGWKRIWRLLFFLRIEATFTFPRAQPICKGVSSEFHMLSGRTHRFRSDIYTSERLGTKRITLRRCSYRLQCLSRLWSHFLTIQTGKLLKRFKEKLKLLLKSSLS
jgi:hypothetical protein